MLMKATSEQLNYDPELHKQYATSNLLNKFLSIVNHCWTGPNVVKCICWL